VGAAPRRTQEASVRSRVSSRMMHCSALLYRDDLHNDHLHMTCDRPGAVARGDSERDVVPPMATATAHDGRVTALLPTPDGLSWLSAATDSRVRLWSVPKFRCRLVRYFAVYRGFKTSSCFIHLLVHRSQLD